MFAQNFHALSVNPIKIPFGVFDVSVIHGVFAENVL